MAVTLFCLLMVFCLSGFAHGANQTVNAQDASHHPVRFVLFSVQESGTHFFRNVFLSQPKIYFWNEICLMGPKSLESCLDKLSFALALPTLTTLPTSEEIEYMSSQKDVFKNGETPKCSGKSLTQAQCFDAVMQRASAIGCILHQNQGWGRTRFLESFVELYRLNKDRYGIEIKAIFLHRTNFIAHSIAAPNTNLRAHVEVAQTTYTVMLENVYKKYYAFQEKYFIAIKTLKEAGVPEIYVTYEKLCRNSSTFETILQALNIPVHPAELVVDLNTKHHTNHTGAYIRNVDQIVAQLNGTAGANRYANFYTKMDVCMLNDDCVLNPPGFCRNILCFI